MTESNDYWARISRKSGTNRAIDANRDGAFFRDVASRRAKTMALWKRQYDLRRRGKKFLCMLCLKPKPVKQFPPKKKGHVPARCRTCSARLNHKRKVVARETNPPWR